MPQHERQVVSNHGQLLICSSAQAAKKLRNSASQIAKTIESTSIRHRSDTFASYRCLTDIDPMVFLYEIIGYYFTNVLRALQNNLAKIYNARNHIYGENFKLKFVHANKASLWAPIQSFSVKFSWGVWFLQYTNFEVIFLKNSRNVSETPPGLGEGSTLVSLIVKHVWL